MHRAKLPTRIHLISQHLPPDTTSTAKYLAAVAEELAEMAEVTAVSGTPDPAGEGRAMLRPEVQLIHLKNVQAPKHRLALRAAAMTLFAARIFWYCILKVKRDDLVVVVTTPYTATYAVGMGARVRRFRAMLMLYDLYPDVLVHAGLARADAAHVRVLSWLNKFVFRAYSSIVVIGRDMERRIASYVDASRTRVRYIPMWSDVDVASVPDISSPQVQKFRPQVESALVVALSGNLGFTHDPETVFAAAKLLRDDTRIHFLLSGWGVGWARLKALQSSEQLPNVTMLDAVPESDLGAFLMAGDLWMIPYRPGMAGVSVPSRFYNLLALGKPVITLAERHADHSEIMLQHKIGWVVPPGAADVLADTLRSIAGEPAIVREYGNRAQAEVAPNYTRAACGKAYRQLVLDLVKTP